MSSHPSIQAFLSQLIESVSATTLTSLTLALRDDAALVATLVENRAESGTRDQLLRHLIAIANNTIANVNVRLMTIEALYHLSSYPNESFRQGQLFNTVDQLGHSFEALLECQAAVNTSNECKSNARGNNDDSDNDDLLSHRIMLTVLLFRCTGYTRLKAGDLLCQLCNNDERRLLHLLLGIFTQRDNEWPLLIAVMRCMYELTTPLSYFEASEDGTAREDTEATAFLQHLRTLMDILEREKIILTITNEITERWALSVKCAHHALPATESKSSLSSSANNSGGIGAFGVASQITEMYSPLTENQLKELHYWSVLLRYFQTLTQNLAEFCENFTSVLRMQTLMRDHAQKCIATALIPFVLASLQMWNRAVREGNEHYQDQHQQQQPQQEATASGSNAATSNNNNNNNNNTSLSDPHNHVGENMECVNTSLLVLRFVRFALYHGALPTQLSHELQTALLNLTHFVSRLEPIIRKEYIGLLIMVITVDCLCNVNAMERVQPVNLAAECSTLVNVIATDTTKLRANVECTAAGAFALCFNKLESVFRGAANATSELVHSKFAYEEQELEANTEMFVLFENLENQLSALQTAVMQLAIGEILSEMWLNNIFWYNTENNNYEYNSAHVPLLQDSSYSSSSSTSHPPPPLSIMGISNEPRFHNIFGASPTNTSNVNVNANSNKLNDKSSGSNAKETSASHEIDDKNGKKSSHSTGSLLKYPESYRCQLTGKVMREPVTLKNGHRFEYDALMNVVDSVGHVDPISGEAINEAIEIDTKLQREIARFRVKRAAKSHKK